MYVCVCMVACVTQCVCACVCACVYTQIRKDKIRFIWDYNIIVSHEYNTRIVYKVTLQVDKYRRLKQRLTCTRCAVRNTT